MKFKTGDLVRYVGNDYEEYNLSPENTYKVVTTGTDYYNDEMIGICDDDGDLVEFGANEFELVDCTGYEDDKYIPQQEQSQEDKSKDILRQFVLKDFDPEKHINELVKNAYDDIYNETYNNIMGCDTFKVREDFEFNKENYPLSVSFNADGTCDISIAITNVKPKYVKIQLRLWDMSMDKYLIIREDYEAFIYKTLEELFLVADRIELPKVIRPLTNRQSCDKLFDNKEYEVIRWRGHWSMDVRLSEDSSTYINYEDVEVIK